MKDAILHAKPRSLAIAGAVPFAIALCALSTRPTTGGPSALLAAVYAGAAMVLLWAWVVGHALNACVDAPRRPSRGAFRVAVVFCAAYSAVFLGAVAGEGAELVVRYPVAAGALHLVALIAMLKVLHFIGANLTLAEDENAATAGSAWTTTLALFSIGGILPVQKRVNRLFARR
jgi:hypothetical protein